MRPHIIALAALILSVTFGTTLAAPPSNAPCVQDMTKFCGDVQPGQGGIIGCLKLHEAELSNACRTHQQQIRAKVDTALGACKDDAAIICKGVTGKGRMHACLRAAEADLSEACRDYLRGGKQGAAAK